MSSRAGRSLDIHQQRGFWLRCFWERGESALEACGAIRVGLSSLRITAMGRFFSFFLVFPTLPLIPTTSFSQCVYPTISVSRIRGTVLDPSGGPVPNAAVSLQLEGKVIAIKTTDKEGQFSIPANPGKYDLHATARGFAPDFSRIEVGSDVVRILIPTHIWMILKMGVPEEDCGFATTSRRRLEKALLKHK
jgi:hypothetical protein